MSLIDRNSKLFQKFIQNKAKQTDIAKNSIEKRSLAQEKKMNSQNLQVFVMNDQNVNTINIIPSRQKDNQIDEKITANLKQELQRQRNQRMKQSQIHKEPHFVEEDIQIKGLKQQIYQLKLQTDYLTKQNIQLKKQLQQQLEKAKHFGQEERHSDDHYSNKIQVMEREVVALREQNYLAKDYLYKLTLKLYQSQKRNQQLQNKLTPKVQNQPASQKIAFSQASSLRHRQFSTSRHSNGPNKQALEQIEPRQNQVKMQDTARWKRVQQINKQLEQLQQLKVFNGKNRRRKIELQRQLQQLNSL